MPLITCHHCQKSTAGHLEKCQFCGTPHSLGLQRQQYQASKTAPEKLNGWKAVLKLLGALYLLGAAFAAYSANEKGISSPGQLVSIFMDGLIGATLLTGVALALARVLIWIRIVFCVLLLFFALMAGDSVIMLVLVIVLGLNALTLYASHKA